MDRQVSSSKNSHQSGSALLVSIALLSMLALLGILIMQQARVASTTTKSHTRNAQAKITAHSGLERAFSLINQEVQIKQTPVGGAGAGFYYGRTGPGYEQNISQKNVPLREAYWTSYSQPRSGSHPLADRNQNKSIEIHGIGSNKTGSDGIDNDGDEEADESDEGGGGSPSPLWNIRGATLSIGRYKKCLLPSNYRYIKKNIYQRPRQKSL